MALTIASEAITDWTAVAQNTIVESGIITLSSNYNTMLHIQSFLDTTTAHTGTKFIVQVSQQASGDEDWQDYGGSWTDHIGTAVTDAIENDPLAAASTSITLTAHGYTTEGIWLAIEDSTLADSELVFLKAQTTNALTLLDGTTNAHAVSTAMFNIASTKVFQLPMGCGMRARLIVDNSYDNDGSTLNYKVNAVKTTAV